MLKPSLKLRFM